MTEDERAEWQDRAERWHATYAVAPMPVPAATVLRLLGAR